MKRRVRRGLAVFLCMAALVSVAGIVWPLQLPARIEPVRVLDRDGLLIAERRVPEKAPGAWTEAPSAVVIQATLAAEDHRFGWHPGVDPIAVLRATGENLKAGHTVQGGSTITQQLARNLWERPPGLPGKAWEAWTALRLEWHLSKDEILKTYLNTIYYGNLSYGVEAAARGYFDKSSSSLSLAEAALLASLPRRPSELDPWEFPIRAQMARDRLIDRMESLGWISSDAATLARAEPLGLREEFPWYHAPHFVRRLPRPPAGGAVKTTLDLGLQRAVQDIAQRIVHEREDWGVDQAAVVVLDTQTSEVLAYLGSIDWQAEAGQVDGAAALRSPGSALKPFVYWLGLERDPREGGVTLATTLEDLPGAWGTTHGTWSPHNYDRTFHGPVTARDALARSLNLPAVRLAEVVGVSNLLRRLQDLGVTTLTERPAHYGLGLALGDGEVQLDELTAAYAALGRLGQTRPTQFLTGDTQDGQQIGNAAAAWLVLQALDDPNARAPAFGRDSVLEPPFFLAAKTGTSVGWRDNWAFGVSTTHTIGVWVGNFDGRPMREVSGISGAGPILYEVALAAHTTSDPAPPAPDDIETARICPLSGLLVSPSCTGGRNELFRPKTTPERTCSWHQTVEVDATGALATGCAGTQKRLIVDWPATYSDWAVQTGQLRRPERDRSCIQSTEQPSLEPTPPSSIRAPKDGTSYYLDPRDPPEQQAIALRAGAPTGTRVAVWRVDDEIVAEVGPPFSSRWIPTVGQHTVTLQLDGQATPPVTIWVGGASTEDATTSGP